MPGFGKHKKMLTKKVDSRWFGHVEKMDKDSWVKKCREMVVEGHGGRDRPRKTWDEVA